MQPPVRRFDAHVALDVRHVAETAKVLGVAEYEIFQLAYRFRFERDIGQELQEEVFSGYLHMEKVPQWARDYCRRVLNLAAVGQLDPRDFGVDKPDDRGWPITEQLFASFVTLLAFIIYMLFLV